MKAINGKVYTHYANDLPKRIKPRVHGKSLSTHKEDDELPKNVKLVSVARVRESLGFKVRRFRRLVKYIAELGYMNQQFNLLYRGQDEDYKDQNGRSRVYPTICRPKQGKSKVKTSMVRARYDRLRLIRRQLLKNQKKVVLQRSLFRYREYYDALIQHYKIEPTPMIDLTQSLRVAATLALEGRKSGYVLVFGMPHPQGSISHFVDQEMVLVKLQNVCPPGALRPHYQEGYLVGKLPFSSSKEVADNLGRRLIGKYHLDNSDGKFWDKIFPKISDKALFPKRDPFRNKLINISRRDTDSKALK